MPHFQTLSWWFRWDGALQLPARLSVVRDGRTAPELSGSWAWLGLLAGGHRVFGTCGGDMYTYVHYPSFLQRDQGYALDPRDALLDWPTLRLASARLRSAALRAKAACAPA